MPDIEKFDLNSMNITEEKLKQLKQIMPEVFTESDKVDFDKLKLTLGENIDTGKERFGMNWPGKADCFKIIQKPSIGTLVPCREESVDFDNTENLFIEGDNLEVLKLLQKSYFGKIKMIYIDPPYNTGNDFIYPDDYSETLDTYLRYTGQLDSEGRKFSTNVESDGRFHSKWMNMMYPRLFLAKNLLRDDGVIFISIDDNEASNLRKICDEIFGEENFIGQFNWFKSATPPNLSNKIKKNIEYVICYEKHKDNERFKGIKKFSKSDDPMTKPQNSLKVLKFKKGWLNFKQEQEFYESGIYGTEKYPNELLNDLIIQDFTNSNEVSFKNRFIWTQEKLEEEIKSETVMNVSKNLVISYKKKEYNEEVPPNFINTDVGVSTTEEAGKKLIAFFNNVKVFEYPKPTCLIKYLINFKCKKDDIILDFFAGSCPLAESVINLNLDEGNNQKYIIVQLPEKCSEESEAYLAGFRNIADIGKERIRKVLNTIKKERESNPTLFDNKNLDLGFKVFKLQTSNFKIWNSQVEKEKDAIEKQLEMHVVHIDKERTQEDILYELLLKSGFPLTTKIEKITLVDKEVFSISEGAMLICLEKDLTKEIIEAMAEMEPSMVVCLDEGFKGNDQLKTNAVQIMKSKGVEKFQTV